MTVDIPANAPFRAMTEGTKEQWAAIAEQDRVYESDLADRMLVLLGMLKDERHGFAIDRLQHCLQTATRALRDGRDEEYVVCALLHDVGAGIAPDRHAAFIAMILRPYICDKNHWMLLHHNIFQGYYFSHFFGGDRTAREQYREHPAYEHTAQFCHLYDQAAFDPDYDTLPLEAFEPMLRRVLANPKRRR